MKKLIYGGIPESVTYVLRRPEKVARGWDDLDETIGEALTVTPAFPIDPTSKSSLATAIHWTRVKKPKQVTVKNDPIKSVQVVTLERRGEGGRAYKVLVEGAYYVDLREDVFIEAMLLHGVAAGGILKGPFVWGKLGSQLRLVRVGSSLYEAMRAADKVAAAPLLTPAKYEVGAVYLNKKDEPSLFVGYVDTEEVVRPRYRDEKYTVKTHRNVPLWCDLRFFGEVPYGTKRYQERWVTGLAPEKGKEPDPYAFKVNKQPVLLATPAARVKLGNDVFGRIRRLARLAYARDKWDHPDPAELVLAAHVRAPGEPRPLSDTRFATFFEGC